MKKRNVKNLQLNKSNVSKFNNILGGRAPGGDTISDPVQITDNCPPSLPHTDCYCGSDFKNGCGSIIGHC